VKGLGYINNTNKLNLFLDDTTMVDFNNKYRILDVRIEILKKSYIPGLIFHFRRLIM